MNSKRFKVQACPHGRGLYAAKPFGAGETLFDFEGKEVESIQVIDPGDEGYYLQISCVLYVDTVGFGRFTCHSCEPNAGLSGERTLVAIKPIHAGQEICFDYSTCMLENSWTLQCNCGTPSCRQTIRDFNLIPQALQEKYRKMNIVPPWILDALSS